MKLPLKDPALVGENLTEIEQLLLGARTDPGVQVEESIANGAAGDVVELIVRFALPTLDTVTVCVAELPTLTLPKLTGLGVMLI
jgi:hypothetical protein